MIQKLIRNLGVSKIIRNHFENKNYEWSKYE